MSLLLLFNGGGGPSSVPTNVSATATGPNTMTVTWTPPDLGTVIGYDIERNGTIVAFDHSASPFNDTGLTPDTEYTYRVRAVR